MNSRGITEIVILTVGRELGVISPALFTIMVIMALVTTFMTTPLLSWLYPRAHVERDVMAEHHREATLREYGNRRVMVGVTDPVTARPLVRIAGSLRGTDGLAATVVLASVISPPGHEEVRANLGDFVETNAVAAGNLATVANGLDNEGVTSEIVTRVGTDRAEELSLLIQQQAIDLMVVGSHQAYLRNRPLGGLVGELLRSAPADVAVTINSDAMLSPGPGPVGIWLPGEPTDAAVLDLGQSLARGLGRHLTVVAGQEATVVTDMECEMIEVPRGSSSEDVVTALEGVAILALATPLADSGLDIDVVESLTAQRDRPVILLRTAPAAAAIGADDESLAATSHQT
jgi:nucleotide-binding universal stress UspA family protein